MIQIDVPLPGNCFECPLRYDYGIWCTAKDDGLTDWMHERLKGCPLVETEFIETKEQKK